MAIIDYENEFSDAQAVTATAASTRYIDLTNTDPQFAGGIDTLCIVRVDTAFAGGTSIIASLETDDNSSFNSATKVVAGPTVLTAAGVVGKNLLVFNLKDADLEQYIRVKYTVSGTMSAGKVNAFLCHTNDSGVPTVA